ncbi:hypothetical protein LCGC14_1637710, partial [marine sediment metagenome]
MNWYRIIKLASDYENYKHLVQQKSLKNPYPFSSWFDEDGRTYLPFTPASAQQEQSTQVDTSVERELAENGYQITDYRGGYCQSGNRTLRIGKVLQQLRKNKIQEAQRKFQAGELYNLERELESIRNYYNTLTNTFTNSPIRAQSQKQQQEFLVLISQNPHDVASMSTGRDWTSCMELGEGSHHEDIFCEIERGGLVAYLINKNDINVEQPLARIHIRRFDDREGKSFAVPEKSIYGNATKGFPETVKQWLDERQGDVKSGIYERQGGKYSDTFSDTMLVAPQKPENIIDWWRGKARDAEYSTWIVVDNLYEEYSREGGGIRFDYGGDQYDAPERIQDGTKIFKNKEKAEKYFQEKRMEDWKYGETNREELDSIMEYEQDPADDEIQGIWSKRHQSGQWDELRYYLQEKKHDNRPAMKREAVSMMLQAEKGTYPIEIINEVKNYILGPNGQNRGLNRMFFDKYPELLTDEDVSKLKDSDNIDFIKKLPDEDPRKASFIASWKKSIEEILANVDILNNTEMQQWLGQINISSDIAGLYDRYKMHLELAVHDYLLTPLQELFKPIPEIILQQLVNLPSKLIEKYFSSIPDSYKEKFTQKVNTNIVHTFYMTGSDTPT